MSTLQRLTDRGSIKPPRWLPGNVQYETIMGSVAYGVASDTSDVDVYGWAIPMKDDIFPHLIRSDEPTTRQQRRERAVGRRQKVVLQVREGVAVRVPGLVVAEVDLHQGDPRLDQPPSHQQRPAEGVAAVAIEQLWK